MKKIFFCLMLILAMSMLFCATAVAEDYTAVAGGPIPAEPFSWDYLATIAGATLATMLIVQLLKLPLDRICDCIDYQPACHVLYGWPDITERITDSRKCGYYRAGCHGRL